MSEWYVENRERLRNWFGITEHEQSSMEQSLSYWEIIHEFYMGDV